MDHGDVVISLSVYSQRCFLFEGLFEPTKKALLSHSVDSSAAEDVSCSFAIEGMQPQSHILQLFALRVDGLSAWIVFPTDVVVAGSAFPAKNGGKDDNFNGLRGFQALED